MDNSQQSADQIAQLIALMERVIVPPPSPRVSSDDSTVAHNRLGQTSAIRTPVSGGEPVVPFSRAGQTLQSPRDIDIQTSMSRENQPPERRPKNSEPFNPVAPTFRPTFANNNDKDLTTSTSATTHKVENVNGNQKIAQRSQDSSGDANSSPVKHHGKGRGSNLFTYGTGYLEDELGLPKMSRKEYIEMRQKALDDKIRANRSEYSAPENIGSNITSQSVSNNAMPDSTIQNPDLNSPSAQKKLDDPAGWLARAGKVLGGKCQQTRETPGNSAALDDKDLTTTSDVVIANTGGFGSGRDVELAKTDDDWLATENVSTTATSSNITAASQNASKPTISDDEKPAQEKNELNAWHNLSPPRYYHLKTKDSITTIAPPEPTLPTPPSVSDQNISKEAGVSYKGRGFSGTDPNPEDQVHFSAWPKPDQRTGPRAQVRRVILRNLPSTVTGTQIASLIWGGQIEAINHLPGSSTASVLFIDPDECKNYYDQTANGVEFPGPGLRVIWVELGTDIEPLSSMVKLHVSLERTRWIRVIGIDGEHTLEGMQKLAMGDLTNPRKLEFFKSYLNEKQVRVADFRFMNISHAVAFKTQLDRDEDFEMCNIVYIPDPCAAATGVHVD